MKKKIALLAMVLFSVTLLAQRGVGVGRFRGTVLGLNGEVVPGAKVTFTPAEDWAKTREADTNEKGLFSMVGLESLDFTITVEAPGYYKRTYNYKQTANTLIENITIVGEGQTVEGLGPQPKVSGQIKDSSGAGIAEAKITVYSPDYCDYKDCPIKRETVTDANGHYSIEGFGGVTVDVLAEKDGYGPMIGRRPQPKDDDITIDVELKTYEELGVKPTVRELTPEEKAGAAFNLALDLYQSGELGPALEKVNESLGHDPEMEQSLKLGVYINRKLGDWDQVLSFSESLLKINPKDTQMIEYAQEAARLTGKTQAAKEYKEKMREVKGVTPDSLYGEIAQLINAGKDDEALPLIDRLIKMAPENPLGYLELGQINIRNGNFDDGVKNLKYFLKYAEKDHPRFEEIRQLVLDFSE